MSQHTRPLNRQDYKTLTLAALGGALEFYDFIIFVFFAAVVGELFFPADIPEWLRQVQTFGIFAAGYLARPLGGIIMAHFGDLVGRKKMFTLSILLMAIPTLAIGLLPTYASMGILAPLLLLLMRILQGAAIGGEVPGAWVFVAEHVPERRIGIACGTLTAGLTVGILLGSVVATLVNTSLTQQAVHDYGWRIPFLCSAVLVIIGLYVRLRMTETPIFRKAVEQDRVVKHPLRSLLPYWKEVLLGTFAMGITYSLFYVLGTWSLSYAVKVMKPPFSQNEYLAMQMVSVVFFAIFIFVTCIYSDKLGRKTVLISTTLATLVFSLFAMQSLQHNVLTVMLFLCVGFALMGGLFGPCGAYLPELFPTHVRYSGAGLSYNLAAILGGAFAPAISTALVKSTGAVESVGWYLAVMSALALIALFLIKESKDEDYEK